MMQTGKGELLLERMKYGDDGKRKFFIIKINGSTMFSNELILAKLLAHLRHTESLFTFVIKKNILTRLLI